MSVFCPKCQNITYDEYTCDKCQHIIKEKFSHNYQPKKRNKLSSYKGNQQDKGTITLNKNNILIAAVVVIAISVSYLAINKLTEDTPQEKALKALYGTSDMEKIKKMNNKIVKEAERAIEEAGNKQIELFKIN